MTEARKKQAKKGKIVKATNERIENLEPEKKGKSTDINLADAKLTVPYKLATQLNQNLNLRKAQNNIRKQLCVYVENEFETFVDDCKNITDPSIRARLYVEITKLIIPRPKDFGEGSDSEENRRKVYKRLFGEKNTD